MKRKKLIKQMAKFAIKHGMEIKLEAKQFSTHERKLLGDAGNCDKGVELHVWMPKEETDE